MADPEQIARWGRAESAIRAALAELRPILDHGTAVLAAELLDHNELGVAMDALVAGALASAASELPAEVLQNLRDASAEMAGYLPDEWPRFSARFG